MRIDGFNPAWPGPQANTVPLGRGGPATRAEDPERPADPAARGGERAGGGAPDRAARFGPASILDLGRAEKAEIRQLKRQDAEVRRHERAHAAAGGIYAGTPRYGYEQGPDGRRYAVSGEVSIDTAPAADPGATVRKMDQVIRAALAPVDPSAADRQVAARARQTRAEAQTEVRRQSAEAEGIAPRPDDGAEDPKGPAATAAAAYGRAAGSDGRTGEAERLFSVTA